MLEAIIDKHGREFTFRYVRDADRPDTIRIYVEKFPKQEALDRLMATTLGAITPNGNGAPYYLGVVADYAPTDHQQAHDLASIWVAAFSQYLDNGAPQGPNESDVTDA